MLNIREVPPPGRSTRPTTDEPFSYDTPDGTGIGALSTIVHGMVSTPFNRGRQSRAVTTRETSITNYAYDAENGTSLSHV